MHDAKGVLPVAESVPYHDVPLIISSFTPENLDVAGGEIVTVIGENFPTKLQDHPDFKLTFADGTACTALETTATQVKCRTERFSKETILSARTLDELEGRRDLAVSTNTLDAIASSMNWGFGSMFGAPATPPLVTSEPSWAVSIPGVGGAAWQSNTGSSWAAAPEAECSSRRLLSFGEAEPDCPCRRRRLSTGSDSECEDESDSDAFWNSAATSGTGETTWMPTDTTFAAGD